MFKIMSTSITILLLAITITSFAAMTQITSKQDFYTKINSNQDLKIVYFTADWCRYCDKLKPILYRLMDDYEQNLPIYSVDLDENPSLGNQYDVSGIPTVLLIKNGQVQKKYVGLRSEKTYRKAIEKYIEEKTARK